ncbi:hypothetical protein CSB07_00745 [Candidatus Gracilibacteria bacterium]|nr:MAG: hypothetical protein CSB07_00745 [Candidatus Gracilibacteria bacterium]PIE85020.1 MAG: hypothetical protein CSA08_04230 [Candidatus Gracilibacteria bacterium]
MKIRVIDISLDKENYLYGIDKNINLSFKLKTANNTYQKVKKVSIYYGTSIICYGNNHFINRKNIILDKNIEFEGEKEYRTSIPIRMPNITGNPIDAIKKAVIPKSTLLSNKSKKSTPEKIIYCGCDKGFIIEADKGLERIIYYGYSKSNKDQLTNITEGQVLFKTEFDGYYLTLPNIKDLEKEYIKIKNFIYIKVDNLNIKKEVIPKIIFSSDKYKELNFKNIIDYRWIDSLTFINYSSKSNENQLKENKNITDDKVLLKKEFNGLYLASLNINNFGGAYINNFGEDYINKDLLNNMKNRSILFSLLHFVLNSRIYGLFYKCFSIVPIILFILTILIKSDILPILFKKTFIGAIFFYAISKIIEIIYKRILLSSTYNININSSNTISYNINEKLKTGELSIYHIFKEFEILNIDKSIDYIFSVRLDTYLSSFKWRWKNLTKETTKIKGLQLFYDEGKGEFNINNIKLLDNDYDKINEILIPVFSQGWVEGINKTYYKLAINFKSSCLPDYEKELNINFNKKAIFDSSKNDNKKKWLVILVIILHIFLSLLSEEKKVNEDIEKNLKEMQK